MADEPDSSSEEELDPETLKRRARLGVVVLLFRTVVLQIGIFVANLFLARLLEPGEFGAFAVVQFVLALFNLFGDAGLGAALIQSKKMPSQRALSSVFNAQMIIASVVLVAVWISAGPIISLWDDMPDSAAWLLRSLSIALFLTTMRVMPTILMERQLQFGRLAVLDVVTTMTFYVSAIVLAVLGWGVWALVGSVLLQAVVSVVLAYAMRPWRPSLELDTTLLRPIVRYGLPFQAKNVVAFGNGAISPVYAGAVLGVDAVGYINWAQGTAYFPLKLVEVMARVTFPLYSRLQSKKEMLIETLGRSVHLCAAGTMFMVALYLGLGEPIIQILYTDRWMPALPLLYLYAGAISIGFLAPIFAAALDASGRPELFFKLSIGWTLLNWAIVPVTTHFWGMLGFSAGYIVHVVVGNLVVIFIVREMYPGLNLLRRVLGSVIGGIVVWQLGTHVLEPIADTGLGLGIAVFCAAATYVVVVFVIDGKRLKDAFALVPTSKSDAEGEVAVAPAVD